MNKSQAMAILELAKKGPVPTSEWTNGSGRYTTRRAIPEGAVEWSRYEAVSAPETVQVVFRDRPRVERVIGLVDVQASKQKAIAYLTKKKYPIPM